VALNENRYLRAKVIAMQYTTISDHHLKGINGGYRKMQKYGDAQLHKIVSSTAVH